MKSQKTEKKHKKKIFKKWEKELTPPNYSSFEEFNQYQKENAIFNKCYISLQDVSIFFHCRECCKKVSGLYCIYCYKKSDHADHHVSVLYLNDAFCDCGDGKFIKKESWCSDHIHQHDHTNFLSNKYSLLYKSKVYEIFNYAIKDMTKKSFSNAIQFLLNITDWGSLYIDLISQVLYDGNWESSFYGKIIRSYNILSKTNIEQFRRFLLKLVKSPTFKKGFILFTTHTLKILSLFYSDPDFPKQFIDIASFAFQCLDDGQLNIQLQETDSFITNIISFLVDVFTNPPFLTEGKYAIPINYNWDFHYLCSTIVSSVISDPLTCRFIFNQPSCLKAIAKLLMINSSNVNLVRQTNEKENFSQIHLHQLKNFLAIRPIYEYFALNFPMLAVGFDEDINYNDVLKCPIQMLDDENILTLNQFFKIFIDELDKILDFKEKSSSFKSLSYFIQPYTEQFVIDHPLAKIIISCATCFSIYNSANLFSIFDRISFKKFDQLAALFACCEASRYQILNDFFLMNNDGLRYMADRIDHFHFFTIPALQSLISIKHQIEDESPGDIIIIIAESFGLPIWEDVLDPVDSQRWTYVITCMLRLFINIACNDNIFNFLLDHEKVRNMIIDIIYCGENQRIEIINRINEFTYDLDFIDEEFEKVVDIRIDEQGSHFTLKPEYDDTSSVFSPYLYLDEFNKMLSYEITNHKGRLLRIKRFDPPETLIGLKSYLQTDELKTVIYRILTTTLKSSDKFSISCSHTLFSLIRLVLLESENPEETEEIYINSSIIDLLIQLVKKLDDGILYLQNFIEECTPRYQRIADIVSKEIQEDINKNKKNKPKIDKSKILQQFQNLQKNFFDKNENELKTIKDSSTSSFSCVFCEESFTSDKPYGILANIYKTTLLNNIESIIANDGLDRYPPLCQIRICGHWSHKSCFEEENNFDIEYFLNDMGKQCPCDRTYANAIIPTFEGDEPDDKWKEAFQKLSDQIIHVCGASAQQCLAYNIALIEVLMRSSPQFKDYKKTVLGLFHLFRSCFFIEPSMPIIEPADPFVHFAYDFCSGGDLKGAQKKFDSLLPTFWHNLMMPTSIIEDDQQPLMIETYVRRVSLLEQLITYKEPYLFEFPTVSEFIKSHHLSNPTEEMKKVQVDLENFPFLSPCLPYTFPNLEESFTDYFLNSKIVLESHLNNFELVQCLLCGKLCYLRNSISTDQSEVPPPVESFPDHCMKCTGNLCTPILFLTGELASVVCIFDGDFVNKLMTKSIYTDVYGDQNIGLKDGNLIFLNKSKVTRLFEDLVTGEMRRKLENINS